MRFAIRVLKMIMVMFSGDYSGDDVGGSLEDVGADVGERLRVRFAGCLRAQYICLYIYMYRLTLIL